MRARALRLAVLVHAHVGEIVAEGALQPRLGDAGERLPGTGRAQVERPLGRDAARLDHRGAEERSDGGVAGAALEREDGGG